jgi:hypothetical protein
MFRIDMLKAGWGDCLWIEYGNRDAPKRILIDGGITSTYNLLEERILALPKDDRYFELFVITHVDGDHIEGAIKLLGRTDKMGVTFGDIWFNGYKELQVPEDRMGGMYGEFLSALIEAKGLPHNRAFNETPGTNHPVAVAETGGPPLIELDENLTATILSPTPQKLKDLIPRWIEEIEKAGLQPESPIETVLEFLENRSALKPEDDLLGDEDDGLDIEGWAALDFPEDHEEPNGSSIAILFEFRDEEDGKVKKCLMTGDAFPSVLSSSLRCLIDTEEGRLELDVLKMSHHGSRKNTSVELLKMIDCKTFMFSSSGQRFKHPNKETIARVLVNQKKGNVPSLYFNYLSELNKMWNIKNPADADFPYDVRYAEETSDCISVEIN